MNRPTTVRVQKVIAERGMASRREAEGWIEEGRVCVNGEIVSLGARCDPDQDKITVDGNTIARISPHKIVIAMNKPKGFLCSNDDPHATKTVFDLLPEELKRIRLFCVGRLDKDSEGLLLLTNDGSIQQKLAHPSYNVLKKYHVDIDKPLQEADVPKLVRGIKWEGEQLRVERVFPRPGKPADAWKQLEIVMHHGKKREIRRLLYAFGYNVKKLRRVQIGNLRLSGLPRGHIKTLGKREIRQLFES